MLRDQVTCCGSLRRQPDSRAELSFLQSFLGLTAELSNHSLGLLLLGSVMTEKLLTAPSLHSALGNSIQDICVELHGDDNKLFGTSQTTEKPTEVQVRSYCWLWVLKVPTKMNF